MNTNRTHQIRIVGFRHVVAFSALIFAGSASPAFADQTARAATRPSPPSPRHWPRSGGRPWRSTFKRTRPPTHGRPAWCEPNRSL
jgi:hypothetical protein